MSIVLSSPLAGWAAGLDETPDEAFAGGALGDGVAIDPTDATLRAPCDGEVITLARTGHAVAIRSREGAEILMHVGIDSVALNGKGFRAHVVVGQDVRAGDALLSFDLETVGRGARSLITPILVSNPEKFEIVRWARGPVRAGDTLLELRERTAALATTSRSTRPRAASVQFTTGLPDGVHARPAARIVTAARAAGVEVTVGVHGGTASAYSALGLMGLGVTRGDKITLWADGPDAPAAFAALMEAFASLPDVEATPRALELLPAGSVLVGTKGSPGLVTGEAFHYAAAEIAIPTDGAGVIAETRALHTAIADSRLRLEKLAESAPGARGDILRAHLILLDDPMLRDAASAAIGAGATAGAAWRSAIQRQADLFLRVDDRRLRERRADLLDLERQVLVHLYGSAEPPKPPPGAIILAEELPPTELAALAGIPIAGMALSGGGATSHVAIMAAALGLPAVMAVSGIGGVPDGAVVILDADAGRLVVSPDAATLAEVQERRERRTRRRATASVSAGEPCVTADGRRIAVYANLAGADEAERAVAEGAEGCGLLRSEFLFQDRTTAPDEDEQHAAYQAVADRLQGRPLTIRTLDIGGDKPAPYLSLPVEENPALGLRGVRVSLWKPELLRAQLRAVLHVEGTVSILVPMVSSVHEIAAVRGLLIKEATAMGLQPPPLGVMVETPAAALTVGALAEVADFFSIGANDLAQYALAMDRTLPMLSARLDGLHPAVVALMRMATRVAVDRGRKVSVCGGLAADHAAIPLLIGLGVTELSLPPGEVAEVKALVRTLSAAECQAFAESGGAYEDASALRRAIAERWPQVGDAS